MADNTSGHRSVPHTPDLRIQARVPTRDGYITQAVLGRVASFLDTSLARPNHTLVWGLTAERDDDLLVSVLDEVICLLDTAGEAPVDIELQGADPVSTPHSRWPMPALPQVSAVPKAVSLNDLRLSHGQAGWRCAVTLDV